MVRLLQLAYEGHVGLVLIDDIDEGTDSDNMVLSIHLHFATYPVTLQTLDGFVPLLRYEIMLMDLLKVWWLLDLLGRATNHHQVPFWREERLLRDVTLLVS